MRKGQFISMFLIVFIGAAFFSGIRSARSSMEYTINRYFIDNKFMDAHVVSTVGLDKDDLKQINKVKGVKKAYPSYSAEALTKEDNDSYVLKVFGYNKNVNIPIVKDGRLIKKSNECLIDKDYAKKTGLKIGDKISLYAEGKANIKDTLKNNKFKIVGIINLPQYLSYTRGYASIGSGSIDNFMVIDEDVFKLSRYTDIYVTLNDVKVDSIYDEKYKKHMEDVTNRIIQLGYNQCQKDSDELNLDISNVKWYVTNRDDNVGYHDYIQESQRADAIGKVFPIIFFIIAALICLISMTRLVADERQQIGIIKALGYSDRYVFIRYIGYALIPTLFGSVLGVLFGEIFFPHVIMDVYYVLYTGNDVYYTPYNWYYGAIAIVVSVLSTVIVTIFACVKSINTKACELMEPKAPSSGKRLWFEGAKSWKRLSFIVKSSIRNIFRYKKRFVTTLVGIGGCMGLIVVACGLNDSIKVIPTKQFREILTYDMAVILKEGISDKEEKKVYNQVKNYKKIDYTVKVFGSKVTLSKDKTEIEADMMIPEKNKVFEQCVTLRNRDTGEIYEMPLKGAVISEKAAKLLDVGIGEKITISIMGEKKVELMVKHITETYFHHYIYMSKNQYEEIYGKEIDYNQIYGVYNKASIIDMEKFNEDIQEEFKGNKSVEGVAFVKDLVEQTEEMVETLNSVVYILLISAALLTLVVIYNLNSINVTERRYELATLKVLGFYNNEVANYVYRENVILTFLGVIVGIFIGKYLHSYMINNIEMNEVMFGVIIERFSYLLSAAVTIIFTVVVNIIMNYKIKRIDMIETLKCRE